MKHALWIVAVSLISLTGCNLTVNLGDGFKTITYTDADGVSHTRYALTEPSGDGGTLLLILDKPAGTQNRQQVLFRQSFAASAQNELNESRLRFMQHPLDTTPPPPIVRTANPLWPLERAWTEPDEIDYGNWIHKIAARDFLVGSGLSVDCADYAMTLRWIYAHDHHLPAGNTLAGTGELVGSWESTADWDQLPNHADWNQDPRFKKALLWVLNNSFTHSLSNDLYPVLIEPAYVTYGTIFLTLAGGSGHTRTIFDIGPSQTCTSNDNCIRIIWGNEPASEYGYITDFVPNLVGKGEGFLRFRWPEKTATGWQLRAPDQMRGYSAEQYSWDEDSYLTNVSARLGLWSTPEDRYTIVGEAAVAALSDRLTVVNQGYFLCSVISCAGDSGLNANWSTPVRDSSLVNTIRNFQSVAAHLDPSSDVVTQFKRKYSNPLFDGAPFSAFAILSSTLAGKFSGDPTLDFFARWGIASPSDEDRLVSLPGVVLGNWRQRAKLVEAAQTLCFPNGATTPSCDVTTSAFKALATDRLDRAFRQVQSDFKTLFQSQPGDVQGRVRLALALQPMPLTGCSSNEPNQACTLLDYLVDQPAHLQNMTSNPGDARAKRNGF